MATPLVDNALWHQALACGRAGLWDLSPRIEMVHYSAAWKARLGFPRAGLPDSTSSWRSRVHPDDYNAMLRSLRLHLDGYTATYDARFRLRAGANERYIVVQSRGRVIERDVRGDALRMVGTMVALSGLVAPAAADPPCGTGKVDRLGAAATPSSSLGCLDDDALAQVADLLDIAARHPG